MDTLRRSGKTPYECPDSLITSIIWKERELRTAERFAALGGPFYCYNFARVSPGARRGKDLARHTAEIRYVFGNRTPYGFYDETDRVIADAILSAWTTFARTGIPKALGESAWPAFDAREPLQMSIENGLSPRPYAVSELMRVIASMRSD
jgi:para-nitrobenzyl esterase